MFGEILMVVFDEPRQYQNEKKGKKYIMTISLLCDSWMSYILRYRNYSSSIA